jgi:hypothetical protein
MADAKKFDDDDEKNSIYAGDPHDPASFKRFPARPSTMQKVSEYFQPDSTRIMLNQIRKRRGLPSDEI